MKARGGGGGGGATMRSPWASCWRGENAFMECGTKFEMRRKEKKASK